MITMMDTVGTIILFVYGHAFALGLLGFIYWRHASRWRDLARVYPKRASDRLKAWHLQTVYFDDGGAFPNRHRGTVTLALTEAGFAISDLPPFSLLAPDMLIPYSDIRVSKRNKTHIAPIMWGEYTCLEFRNAPDMKIYLYGQAAAALTDVYHDRRPYDGPSNLAKSAV